MVSRCKGFSKPESIPSEDEELILMEKNREAENEENEADDPNLEADNLQSSLEPDVNVAKMLDYGRPLPKEKEPPPSTVKASTYRRPERLRQIPRTQYKKAKGSSPF